MTLYSLPPPIVPRVLPTSGRYPPFSYQGCYSDMQTFPALSGPSTDNAYNTLEQCALDCEGYLMFGMEKGTTPAQS